MTLPRAVASEVLSFTREQLNQALLSSYMEGLAQAAIVAYDHTKVCDAEGCSLRIADTIRKLWERLWKDLEKQGLTYAQEGP